jgi:Flp pilus assembly protein TadD
MVYLRDETRVCEALRLAQSAVESAPGNPLARDALGWVQYRMGSYDQAAGNLVQAHEKMPQNPEIAYHLGMVHAKQRRTDKARKLLKEVLGTPNKGEWAFEAGLALRDLDASGR